MGDKVPYETYSQLCKDLDLANVKIKEQQKVIKLLEDRLQNKENDFEFITSGQSIEEIFGLEGE